MGFEIDFLPVGDAGKSGDAIAIRIGNLYSANRSDYAVIVVDGGSKVSGQALVNHLNAHYATDGHIDLVIMTHPDGDHASGLTVILNQMTVGHLAMHLPWEYGDILADNVTDGRLTPQSISKSIADDLDHAKAVYDIAISKGVTISEPFQGISYFGGVIKILGPSDLHYESMLPHFRSTPDTTLSPLLTMFRRSAQEAERLVTETMDIFTETLTDEVGNWSAENCSSVITLFQIGSHSILLTADADAIALEEAINYADNQGIDLSNLFILQVPHHGSRHNVGPIILNRLGSQFAQISAAVEGTPKHPSKQVTNALKRRNAKAYATQGSVIRYAHNAPERFGWGPAQEIPFYNDVEQFDEN